MSELHAAPCLPAVARLADGRIVQADLPAERHRRIHIGLLHEHSTGLVELAAGRRNPNGDLAIFTRKRRDHYLPGGGAGRGERWLDALIALAAGHDTTTPQPDELFVAPCERRTAGGQKWHVSQTHWLWVDVDERERLPALWAFLNERPPHLVVESAGVSVPGDPAQAGDQHAILGGAHAYWKLDRPLPALRLRGADGSVIVGPRVSERPDKSLVYSDPKTGEVLEGDYDVVFDIEQANLRLIHALGYRYDERGRQVPTVACISCKEHGRVLRLAGSRHGDSGRYARIVFADFQRRGYSLQALIGDLPDPDDQTAVQRRTRVAARDHRDDPFGGVSILEIYEALTGNEASATSKVHCPHRDHPDPHPSCDLDATKDCWICRSCGRGGGRHALASAVLGGPTNRELRGKDFIAAHELLVEQFGEHVNTSTPGAVRTKVPAPTAASSA